MRKHCVLRKGLIYTGDRQTNTLASYWLFYWLYLLALYILAMLYTYPLVSRSIFPLIYTSTSYSYTPSFCRVYAHWYIHLLHLLMSFIYSIFGDEYQICQDMVQLLPPKIDRMHFLGEKGLSLWPKYAFSRGKRTLIMTEKHPLTWPKILRKRSFILVTQYDIPLLATEEKMGR